MTIERGVTLIAVHLGVVDEEQINEMSLDFFEEVLGELGNKLNYDAIVNFAGNSFCKDAWDMIQDANPLIEKNTGANNVEKTMASLFGSANIKTVKKGQKV